MATADIQSTTSFQRIPIPRRSSFHGRLKVDAQFCPTDVDDLFATVDWEVRSAQIKGENGELIFEQTNCEVPVVLEPAGHERRRQQVLLRRSRHARARIQRPAAHPPRRPHDRRLGPRRRLLRQRRRRRALLSRAGLALPASARRVQFARLVQRRPVSPVRRRRARSATGTGIAETQDVVQPENPYEYPQGSACFIQSVDDNMEDIMELARSEAMLFKFGSRHRHRPLDAPLAPREALRRRQALRPALVHAGLRPDRGGGEERRQDPPRRQDAVAQGLAPRHHGIHRVQGEGREEGPRADRKGRLRSRTSTAKPTARSCSRTRTSRSASPTTSCRPSRRTKIGRPTGSPTRSSPARPTRPARCWTAWPNAPGTAAIRACSTTRRSTAGTPARTAGRSTPVNPCIEYMFLDDTACNLASINLMKFRQADGTFDVERFQAACRIFFIAQEILVDHASYPTQRHRRNSHLFRPLGLGYSNLGSLLMTERHCRTIRDAARGVCGAITALLHGAANLTSAELAAAVGPFDGYEKNREPMLRVMQMHRDAVEEIDAACPAVSARRGPPHCGTKCSPPAACTASATPRPPCSPPPARSAS